MAQDMRPPEPLSSCFFELAKHLGAGSLEDYAYDLMDASDFLEALDPPADLLTASKEDLVAYKDWGREHRDDPEMDATWMRRRGRAFR
ncbi:hypothetical protein EAO75_45485 [Streptomyces sp. uw30]|uniref:hypothetical protein n=1 Tax=Streptomyces sp. uw30 TaxID=1828179 RepID=UPI0011CDBAE0|nr:hypothetical protein [Streptomyces sp. uw30]TXS35030.1 hypothetical protein EAO75_45485 [Streptomyces sp. uw30]